MERALVDFYGSLWIVDVVEPELESLRAWVCVVAVPEQVGLVAVPSYLGAAAARAKHRGGLRRW